MPPVRANGNGPPVGAPNPGNGQSQLNPAQLAQLHEYIRQKRQANGGGDITAAMVTDWMRANQLGPGVGLGGAGAGAAGFPPQLNQQLDPSQQQQLLIAQRQHMLIAHLFPPHLANNQNPAGALQHLQAVLFPPQNLGQPPAQNPLLSQVLTLAQAQRLSPEQMQLLRTAVASRNPPQPPPQQSHPQNSGQQYTAQQQAAMQAHQQQVMAAQAAQAASAHQNQALPPSLPPQQQHQQQQQQGQQPSTAGSEAQHLVVTLQHRVASIENLLKRPDLQGDHRQKAQAELKASQAQLQQVVKGFLAQHPQAPGAAADLQQAQRVAMAQREAEIQRQRSQQHLQQQQQQQAQQQQQIQQNNSAYRSPAQFPQQTLPPQSQSQHAQNRIASPALSAPSPADAAKALLSQSSKKGSGQGGPMSQQQAALVAQQQSSLASSQAQALAQAQAQAMVHSKTHAQQSPLHHPPPSSQPTLPTPIPSSLSMPPASPESFPAPRPTLNSGLANAPAVSTPAITKHPGFAPQTIADTLGFGARKKEEGGTGKVKDPRGEEGSKGRTGQKRKIRELVEQVDPEEVLDPEVEDLLLDIADEFIDSMTRFACQLAKHRKSDRLEVKDLALHLDRSYNMKVPGFGPEETRSSQTRRINLPPGYQGRLAAVREASSRGR